MDQVSLKELQPTAATDAGPHLSVLAETAYPLHVASARVRIAGFAPFLGENGVAINYRPTLSDNQYGVLASRSGVARKAATLAWAAGRFALSRSPEYDLLMVHRLRFLSPLPGMDPPQRLDVYDLDDPLFVPFRGGVNQRFRWAKREALRCIECLRRARLVLVGNSFLADNVREYAARVEVVPSCIDPEQQPMRVHRDEGPVTVGWIGSSTTSPYLRRVLPVFARLNASAVRARLVLIGADRAMTAPWIEHRQWSLATEREDLASFDIGIMPQPDDEWARGKCGYKIIQYFAAGVPAISSPVGVAEELLGDERGLLAETDEQWHQAIVSLIEDRAQRAERGAAGRRFVERNYSYQRWAAELSGLLRSVAD